MLRVLTLSALLVFASALAFGETFSGKLVDAACTAQQKSATCTPTASTTLFATQVAGNKLLKLDAEGNRKAADALKENNNSADRAKDPNAPAQVMATVDGTLNGDEIKVDTISIQ